MTKTNELSHIDKMIERIEWEINTVGDLLADVIQGCNGARYWTSVANEEKLEKVENELSEAKRRLAMAKEAMIKVKATGVKACAGQKGVPDSAL